MKLSRLFNFETTLFLVLLCVMLAGALLPSRSLKISDESFTGL